jgi:hypothetical protein
VPHLGLTPATLREIGEIFIRVADETARKRID